MNEGRTEGKKGVSNLAMQQPLPKMAVARIRDPRASKGLHRIFEASIQHPQAIQGKLYCPTRDLVNDVLPAHPHVRACRCCLPTDCSTHIRQSAQPDTEEQELAPVWDTSVTPTRLKSPSRPCFAKAAQTIGQGA